ncbi:adenine deaminase [Halobacillus locisalis]|uniref:Adenine deaminase n=1 Tax=Halobacillus locisalis TaxID=220753 RepID=A0A838CSE5_9BACI|nr:adenine deaminase [Halobacillus locisalis]MBA2174685.1 adenine deaminase [Halobacillus locisalis]
MNQPNHSLYQQLHAASKKTIADLVIKNARILDVFNSDWIEGDVAIMNGRIIGIGEYEGEQVLDADYRYLCPSFIDGHVHIESSMVPPAEFAQVVMPRGVTTAITDPHEIANVAGTKGIEFMLEDANRTEMDLFFMLPSSVPSTPLENAGAILQSDNLHPFYKDERVLGLAEVMDYPALKNAEEGIVKKIIDAQNNQKKIDGHLAGLPTDAINVYRTAGIHTDHECTTAEEAKERLRRGMYVLLREGSVAKDLKQLLPAVTTANSRRCLFCTDDKHLDDLVDEGSIDHHIRQAIQYGIPAETAYQMASLNAAECYGLSNKGAIAPGYDADLLLLDNIEDVKIHEVYKMGKLVAKNGQYVGQTKEKLPEEASILSSVHFPTISESDLQLTIHASKKANIIGINPNQLATNKLIENVQEINQMFSPSVKHDQLKMAVVERHHQTGNIGVGIVKGLQLKSGAIATTVAHDSHNIVAAGTNDQDLLKAIEVLRQSQGGLVIVKDGAVLTCLPLPVAGLMSPEPYMDVYEELHSLNRSIRDLGFEENFNPFLTLSFLTLPVIPKLKLTDTGLFDVEQFKHIDVSL